MEHDGTTEVVEANRKVHTRLATVYDTTEPHFRPENRAKVRRRLEALAASAPSTARMLDLGCGTGFVISLAHDLFERIDGIDATDAMLERVDTSPGNIHVQRGLIEALPFDDATFDAVTTYSVLDHLEDPTALMREAARVLRPGGVLYIDLIPNRRFWQSVQAASEAPGRPFGAIVEREIGELVHHGERLEREYGIPPEVWALAEPQKSALPGFDSHELRLDLEAAGFATVSIDHEWFLGQASLIHGPDPESAAVVHDHLTALLPASAGLFKYLVVVAATA